MKSLQEIVDKGKRIVFFGGAGVSTESGIPDFRSADGLYRQTHAYPPETILSHEFFFSHTADFFDFYRANMLCLSARPGTAHKKLAELEQSGKLSAVITQNIDGLHSAAGSRNVLELHGSVHRNFCLSCGRSFTAEEILHSEGVPRCGCGGVIKPDVVLYGEPLSEKVVSQSAEALCSADLLIVGGTSLSVYPAAGMIRLFKGRRLVLINRDETPMDSLASLILRRSIGEVLGEISVK